MNRHDYTTPEYQIEAQRHEYEREHSSDRAHFFTVRAIGILFLVAVGSGLFPFVFFLIPLKWAALKIGVGIGTIAWFYILWKWQRWIEPLERFVGYDLNRDGRIGQAVEPEQFEIRVVKEHPTGGYIGSSIVVLDQPKEKFQRLCREVASGTSLTYDNFTPQKDGWYTRSDFKKLLNKMETLDWIEQHDNQAPTIRTYGRQVFDHFARMPIEHWAITPPLDEDEYALPAP